MPLVRRMDVGPRIKLAQLMEAYSATDIKIAHITGRYPNPSYLSPPYLVLSPVGP
jgi:hypothetical protein